MAVEDRPDDALRRLRSMATGWAVLRLPRLLPHSRRPRAGSGGHGLGHRARRVLPFLPPGGRCEILDDVGHFVHIEQPDLVAGMVLEHLGTPP